MRTQNECGPVWVIAEQYQCNLLEVSLQLIGKARDIADRLAVDVEVVLIGKVNEEKLEGIFKAGADRIYLCSDSSLNFYQPEAYSEIIVRLALNRMPDIMLIGASSMGRELAPVLAARLKTGLTAHCNELVLDENGLIRQSVAAFGGAMCIVCPDHKPQMAVIAKGVFPTPKLDRSCRGEVIKLETPRNLPGRVQTIEIVPGDRTGIQLEEASVVIAGGAGVSGADGWNLVAELAQELNAAAGCTRPVVDEGWAEIDTMIGQSGKTVRPKIYMGIALSGEQQHMVGIVEAGVMVALNSDENSPVFEQVDYGIVDDCREFLPVLLKKIKSHKRASDTC